MVQCVPSQLQVIDTLKTCAQGEPWAARAACLVFTQYFWFRHCFMLTSEQSQDVQQLVVDMLRDKKLEVQELAAKTLSGSCAEAVENLQEPLPVVFCI